ncbi:uncharacterized protein LOC133704656 isoform X1 [Populus nigra]|uniref:uncharacterized protein LOC133704656 isoform X1 n=2 Tax=Populus nigra TaxID=3691 RepID=UPI002B2766F0|nr:uncharacterized protein LOC133704656 isoform X1 [Populus nigra]XP_061985536.1 uncharacterized protein LOC133704656 isoform X1 [Populus nigra]
MIVHIYVTRHVVQVNAHHLTSAQGLYSLSMPSLEKGDAMSRGFKQHIAKQALIPKIYLKTILDLNFFLGITLARVKHRSWIRNCICVNPKIWRKRFQLLKIMYLSTKISVNDCKSKEDLTNADLSLFGASKKKSFLASAKLLEESAIWLSHVFPTRSWLGLKFCSGQNLPLKQDCRDQNVSDLLCFFTFFSLSFLLSR